MPAASDAPSQEAPDSRKAPDLRGGVPHEETPLEEATRKKLGLQRWDRPALFRETAEAAVDTDLPFWLVLLLSGAIATLGLLLNQTAVVIGAMLVAPLLGPLLGLSLALAIGDGRLAAHTFLTILCGMLGVIAVAAGLTLVLPFTEVTSEIAARTRPTTLDLAIAIFSGLAGAIVTVSRERRLSASIPGVAIAVALIPPLGVSGFGLATGQWALVKGSLLLFGANLGGIVIMGMLAFLAVGMHRDDVREAARKWHDMETEDTFGARIASLPGMNRLGVLRSPLARVALVGAFVAAVAIPLSSSLEQVLREGRVKQAVAMAVNRLEADDEASVLTREIEFGERSTSAALRIATTAWISDEERRTVEAEASDAAGEPVALRLEQVLASRGDIQALADQLPTDPTPAPAPEASGAPPSLDAVRARVADVLASMAVPTAWRWSAARSAWATGRPR
ncbi:TIGR00341 family protein [Rubricoccus marinus]|nr:TIGR00341 family protein [Rubricoccus marinus]